MLNVSQGPKDFWTGLLYLVLGVAAVVISRDYEMGSLLRMGAGYVPTVLGYALSFIGVCALVRSFAKRGERITAFTWRGLFLVLTPIVVFGLIVRGAGLVPAVVMLVVVSAYASDKAKPLPALLLASGMSLFCWLLFIKVLGVPLQAFGTWFGN